MRLDPVGKLSQVWSGSNARAGKYGLRLHRSTNTPSPLHQYLVPGPGAGPDPGTSRFAQNAENAAPTQISTFTKQGHVTHQNASFWMLIFVMPAIGPNSEPGVTILLRGVLKGR